MFNQGYMVTSCHLPLSLQKAKVKLAAIADRTSVAVSD